MHADTPKRVHASCTGDFIIKKGGGKHCTGYFLSHGSLSYPTPGLYVLHTHTRTAVRMDRTTVSDAALLILNSQHRVREQYLGAAATHTLRDFRKLLEQDKLHKILL